MPYDPQTLPQVLARHPVVRLPTAGGQVQYRQAGHARLAPTHVLLHGIGSGSASWAWQLDAAAGQQGLRVLAWDAPGYGASQALPADAPAAADYARRLWQWLDALDAAEAADHAAAAPITLVGHSLGCLMAAAAACQAPGRVQRLLLLSPAQGYARATAAERARKLDDRMATLAALGPQGIADKRASAMLSPSADAALVAFIKGVMAQIDPRGYSQAARMLSQGDLLTDLAAITCPVAVASGNADTITPPEGCRAAAAHIGAPYSSLPGAGHACALESPGAVSELIGLLPGSTHKAAA